MRVIEAPAHAYIHSNEISVFLGGGISNCSDWQSEVISALFKVMGSANLPVVLLNPRRKEFDLSNAQESEKQIQWEFDYLNRADVVLFWFPEETVCPITLYELGFQLGQRTVADPNTIKLPQLVVGTHQNYIRAEDVRIQSYLVDRKLNVCNNLQATISTLIIAIRSALDAQKRV